MDIVFFLVSFLACIVGSICGIGGGVIIKPVLDLLALAPTAAINFMSGCTVLSMSLYSVGRSLLSGEKRVDIKRGTFLAIGAAAGGVIGKQIITWISDFSGNSSMVSGVQAVSLLIVTVLTMAYLSNKNRIRRRNLRGGGACTWVGMMLGICSSFLSIGGGPINLVVLDYFLGMDTKTAAANSLYIIVFSQSASLLMTLLSGSIPQMSGIALFFMVCGGIFGGVCGRWLNKRMDIQAVDKLLMGILVVIVLICIYNSVRFILLG